MHYEQELSECVTLCIEWSNANNNKKEKRKRRKREKGNEKKKPRHFMQQLPLHFPEPGTSCFDRFTDL